jgi:hypothetical protein
MSPNFPIRAMKTQVREPIKTARFTAIVEAVGRPDVHVLLTAPENDKVLQSAIKQNRVMTIEQGRSRGKADRGCVGFSPGQSRQFLIFPKSLAPFAGSSVVAINYELLEQGEAQAPSRSVSKAISIQKKESPAVNKKTQPSSPAKIIPFTSSASAPPSEPVEPAHDLQSELQNAINLLAEGRRDAALNLLERIVKDLRQSSSESSKSGKERK